MKFKDTEYGDLTDKIYLKDINCSKKELTSLYGSPKRVNDHFYCYNNNLTSLKYSPEIVKGHFDCTHNKLNTLSGRPKIVEGIFNCQYNNNLKNIKKQIIENQIRASMYHTDEGDFSFIDIYDEFEDYAKELKKQKNKKENKDINNKVVIEKKKDFKDLNILKNNDYGLGI